MQHAAVSNHTYDESLAGLRQVLEDKRDELRHGLAESPRDVGAQEPGDTGDLAMLEIARGESIELAAQHRALLEDVEHALDKLDGGTYGLSEISGHPISSRRLLALPWARMAVTEAEARSQTSTHEDDT